MSNFTLSWFKRQAELENLIIEEQELKNRMLRSQLGDEPTTTTDVTTSMNYGSPCKSVKLVNDVLIVVLQDGSVLTKMGATADDFNLIRCAISEATVFDIMSTPEIREERLKMEAEAARLKALQEGIRSLEGLEDFEIDGNSVKLRGTGRTMPQLLVEKFIEIVELEKYYAGFGDVNKRLVINEEYQALKRFFMWCCLNPRAEVANDLYEFLNKNSFRITKQGFFVALRNIVTLHGGTELVQFVSNTYNKVKAVWKKKPDDYTVFLENGEYKLVHYSDLYETIEEYDEENEEYYEDEIAVNHGEKIGNLTELYLDLPNRHENRFTDAHTRTFDIRIGQVVNMPPEQCNWSTADCAHAGLHFTADQIHYVGCGTQ